MAAASFHGSPATPRPGTAVPFFSAQYQIAPSAHLSRAESDPLALRIKKAVSRKHLSLEEYLGAKPLFSKANELGSGNEATVYLLDAPKLPVKEVAYKHFNPHTCRPQTPERLTGDVYALEGNVHAYAVVMRNGDDPKTDHVITQIEDLKTELLDLEPKIKEAEMDPAYIKEIEDLTKKIEDLEMDHTTQITLGQTEVRLQLLSKNIKDKKVELNTLKTKHRNKIVGIIMQRLKGVEFYQFLTANPPLSKRRAVNYSLQMLKALKVMHDKNHIHRDLKSENMFLDIHDLEGGRFGTLRLFDFSMSKYLGIHPDPRIQTSCGSPQYACPEIWSNQPYGKGADCFSAGLITYIMITGLLPFHNDNVQVLGKMLIAYGKGHNSSLASYTGVIDAQGNRTYNPLTMQAIEETKGVIDGLIAAQEPCGLALAKVIVGLTKGAPEDRMTLEDAIDILEKADLAQIQFEAQKP